MPRESIFLDPVNPTDFRTKGIIYCCEQCTHFNPETEQCTIGYEAKNHLRRNQLKSYETSGRMAFCRSIEID